MAATVRPTSGGMALQNRNHLTVDDTLPYPVARLSVVNDLTRLNDSSSTLLQGRSPLASDQGALFDSRRQKLRAHRLNFHV